MPVWTKEQSEAIYKDGCNIIVSAGAGSGKTAVLSERVINKLKSGISINELLILTFTNAAAAEMKDRIRKKIVKENLYEELDKIDNAYITTFDAYALFIVKKYNYLLNVSSDLSIIESSIISIKKEEILDSIFEDLYKQKNNKFLKLINDFCSKDDNDIKSAILLINSKLDMIYDIDSYLDNYANNYYSKEFINDSINKFEKLLINKLNIVKALIDDLSIYVDRDYVDKIYEELGDYLNLDNYDDIKNISIKLPNLPRNSEEEAKSIKKQISDIIKEIDNLCIYESKNDIYSSILNTNDYIEVIIDIIRELNIQINQYKSEMDSYEFVDIAKLAIKIVAENEFVREEIKNNLKEIMIDEYQDTNDLQDLFISYISDNNVYMVGDIKQSIYRFRNANPILFKNKYDSYSNFNGGIKIDLNKNFRSRLEVVDNINNIFNYIMDDIIGGADYVKSHQMIFGNNVYEENKLDIQNNNLDIYSYDYNKESIYKKEEIEAFIIANDIKNKVNNKYQILDKNKNELRDIKYNDICILMDRSTNFVLYKKIFEYLNIPLTIYKDRELTSNIDLNIIKNIISLLLNKEYDEEFKYSFVSIMRSYLFNEKDGKIFEYIVNSNYNDSDLMSIIKNINMNNNIKDIIVDIIYKFDFYNKMILIGDIEDHIVGLDYIINIADNLSKLGYTLEDFYNYLTKIIENNDKYRITYSTSKDDNGVKIMTIHASKGLEYSICYFSGLYAKFNISEMKERFLYDSKYGIITPYLDNGIKNTIYKFLAKDDYVKNEISEKIRLFYVALTRAKEKMIMVCPTFENKCDNVSFYTKSKYNSFYSMLNSIYSKLEKYIKNVDIKSLNITRDYELIVKKDYKTLINDSDVLLNVKELNIENSIQTQAHMSKETHKLYDKKQLDNINFGKKIHNVLENIDFNNPNYSDVDDYIKLKIQKLIDTGIFIDALKIYKEHEFIYTVENTKYHGIIDLLIEYEDHIKIIDYKLKNIDDDAYLKQLSGYKDYIKHVSNKPIKLYLYSIIDGNLEELNI